ncbi:Uncharacterised protein [Streptococcus pneumoniae]|nr:Uncharacterised protein [Streptococcus pneumoniae]
MVPSSGPLLPAATTVTTPANIALFTATEVGYKGSLIDAPSDKLITSILSFTALSIAARIPLVCPLPYGPNTRYEYKSTSGATPFTA